VGNGDGFNPSPVTGGSLGVPIYLLNDTKLADNNNDLWDGSINTSLDINENGDFVGNNLRVWTGTQSNGTGFSGDSQDRNLGSTGGSAHYGLTNLANGGWMQNSSGSFPGNTYQFYAMSEILTVPEPGSFMLASIGAIVLMGIRSGRKRTKANAS
jgi:hypothetical protein